MTNHPLYMISVAAELVGMHPQTLRMYEAKGLVRPQRTPGNTRLYSEADLAQLRLIQTLKVRARDQPGRRGDRASARGRASQGSKAPGAPRAPDARRGPQCPQALPPRPRALPRQRNAARQKGEMDFNKLTLKTQEAVAASMDQALRQGNPEVYPEHLILALLDQELPQTLVERAGGSVADLRAKAEAALATKPAVQGTAAQQPRASAAFSRVLDQAEEEMKKLEDDFVSTEHVLLALDLLPREQLEPGAEGSTRQPAGHLAGSRGHVPGPREVRPRPDLRGGAGQARSCDRPRRGGSASHPGALAPDEEQPGPDRRARCRQDGHRRGPRSAHRRRRRSRRAEGQARVGPRHRRAARRGEVPGRVRGAAQGRPERDQGSRGADHPLHRRAPHDCRSRVRPRVRSTPRTC